MNSLPPQSKLHWNTYTNYIGDCLEDIFKKENNADVTLVSDELKPFHAHKFILSVFSSVLKDLLIENSHEHPLIYLRGVRYQELEAVLKFMYHGQTEVSRVRSHLFFSTISQLQIKQLIEISENAFIVENNEGGVNLEKCVIEQDKTFIESEHVTGHTQKIVSLRSTTEKNFFECDNCDYSSSLKMILICITTPSI